jgi:hypothetical protein
LNATLLGGRTRKSSRFGKFARIGDWVEVYKLFVSPAPTGIGTPLTRYCRAAGSLAAEVMKVFHR